jgi:hypothetical protein
MFTEVRENDPEFVPMVTCGSTFGCQRALRSLYSFFANKNWKCAHTGLHFQCKEDIPFDKLNEVAKKIVVE